MFQYDERGELAPRDVVSQAINDRMQQARVIRAFTSI